MEPTKDEAPPKEAASEETKESKKKHRRRIITWIIIILLVLAGLIYLLIYFLSPKPNNYGNMVDVNLPANTPSLSENNLLATTTEAAKLAEAIASSENFDMMQIVLEGSATNVFDFGENDVLTLSNIKNELYSTKEGDKSEIRAVISCQTSKRSYIEVEYFKSGEKDKKVIKDTFLGFKHILVLPALDPDSVYKYSVSATDLNQIKVYSEQYVFYTGVGNISLVDILENAVQKVFGWVIGK